MMKYDGDLQMFVDEPRKLDIDRLLFLRWLVERGMLEHYPFGYPTGELAVFYTSNAHNIGGN